LFIEFVLILPVAWSRFLLVVELFVLDNVVIFSFSMESISLCILFVE